MEKVGPTWPQIDGDNNDNALDSDLDDGGGDLDADDDKSSGNFNDKDHDYECKENLIDVTKMSFSQGSARQPSERKGKGDFQLLSGIISKLSKSNSNLVKINVLIQNL